VNLISKLFLILRLILLPPFIHKWTHDLQHHMAKELKTNLNYDSEGSEHERDVATDTVAESDHQFDSSDDVALTLYGNDYNGVE
jgi:hypothetical protein